MDGSADSREYTADIAPSRKRWGYDMKKMRKAITATLAACCLLLGACEDDDDPFFDEGRYRVYVSNRTTDTITVSAPVREWIFPFPQEEETTHIGPGKRIGIRVYFDDRDTLIKVSLGEKEQSYLVTVNDREVTVETEDFE